MNSLVVATNNRHKAREMVEILREKLSGVWHIKTLLDFDPFPEPDETGDSYEENAKIKAEAAAKHTGELCIADDAGLEIDALGGSPGVHSKRFEGEHTSFDQKIAKILEAMQATPEGQRGARFNCWVAIASPQTATKVFSATREGTIAREPKGEGGFGYDPIFYLADLNKTMAQLTPEQKNATSHRCKVLALVAEYLNTL